MPDLLKWLDFIYGTAWQILLGQVGSLWFMQVLRGVNHNDIDMYMNLSSGNGYLRVRQKTLGWARVQTGSPGAQMGIAGIATITAICILYLFTNDAWRKPWSILDFRDELLSLRGWLWRVVSHMGHMHQFTKSYHPATDHFMVAGSLYLGCHGLAIL
jgi:hypothetical protein